MRILRNFIRILFFYNSLLSPMSFWFENWPIDHYESFGANRLKYKFEDNKKIKPKKLNDFIAERQDQIKQKLRQEKEERIFRKYLASRSQSSFMKDFFTLRY